MSESSPWEALPRYFTYERASTPHQLEEIFRLRYEVYCREFAFERPEDCPGAMETDEYDAVSLHCLLRHARSRKVAGCVRVIVPPDKGFEIPMTAFCGDSLEPGPFHPGNHPGDRICEISRLAVTARFRCRPGEKRSPVGNPDPDVLDDREARTLPLIGISMFVAAAALVRAAKREHVYAMMEPKLARLLGRCGIHFQQIGETVDYHGTRAPYYIHLQQAERDGNANLQMLYAFMLGQLDDSDPSMAGS